MATSTSEKSETELATSTYEKSEFELAHEASETEFKSTKLPLISETVFKVLQREPFNMDEWLDLFYMVHDGCVKYDLEKSMYDIAAENVKSIIKRTLEKIEIHHEDEALVKAYVAEWEKFSEDCGNLSGPFTPLTIKKWEHDANDFSVRKLMLDSWNNDIFIKLAPSVHTSAMNLIDAERNGKVGDPQLIRNLRVSDIDACTVDGDKYFNYREMFEKAYIDTTQAFYQKEVAEVSMASGVVDYMKYADRRFKEEVARADKYLKLDWDSETPLTKVCADLLVVPVQDTILSEFVSMVERNDIENLQRMFRLMHRTTDGIAAMLKELEKFTVDTCLADLLVAAETVVDNSDKYVQRLIDLYNRFGELIEAAFEDDARFFSSRDRAFRIIVNDTTIFKLELRVRNKTSAESKCPELLANYCDLLLRKTPMSKKLTSADVDSKLKDAVQLLKFVSNVDVYMIYYKSHLTRRLLLDTSADLDKEEEMIGWLKEIGMPAEYVFKASQMFNDIQLSVDFNRNLRESNPKIRDSINVKIFTSTALSRPGNKMAVTLPLELEDYVCEMEKFYNTKFSGRKLTWDHQLSTATITFLNPLGKFDLDVTTFQMAVLFAWNERPKDRISFEDLRLATELPEAQLQKTMWTLIATTTSLKRNVVLCDPEVKSASGFNRESLFWINDEFALVRNGKEQKRGKVNLIGRLQLSMESKEAENEEIVQLRELRVQEALIRVAKTRKTIASDQLQMELVVLLKNMFLPTKRLIKEQVEWCIENNYLGRDPSDFNTLLYVA